VSLIPFSLAIGVAIAEARGAVDPAGALAGSTLAFAGAAQLSVVRLLDADAGPIAAVTTAWMINLRFVLYSTGMARWFGAEPLWRRLVLAIPLVDQNFLLAQRRFDTYTALWWRRRYFLMCSALLATTFVAFQIVGWVVGGSLPAGLGIPLAAPLAFVGLLAAAVRDRAPLLAAGVSAVGMVVFAPLPNGLGLLAAASVALVAANALTGERS
jgi:predicted branched-subunit amino acid permease